MTHVTNVFMCFHVFVYIHTPNALKRPSLKVCVYAYVWTSTNTTHVTNMITVEVEAPHPQGTWRDALICDMTRDTCDMTTHVGEHNCYYRGWSTLLSWCVEWGTRIWDVVCILHMYVFFSAYCNTLQHTIHAWCDMCICVCMCAYDILHSFVTRHVFLMHSCVTWRTYMIYTYTYVTSHMSHVHTYTHVIAHMSSVLQCVAVCAKRHKHIHILRHIGVMFIDNISVVEVDAPPPTVYAKCGTNGNMHMHTCDMTLWG